MDKADGGGGGSTRVFPALGFDPAEGDIEQVRALLLELSSALRVIGTTLPRLTEATDIADDAEWGGDAAEEFADHGDDLPLGLAAGAEGMATVSEALGTWAGQLAANQRRADQLERRAKQLRSDLAAAENAESAATGVLRDSPDPQSAAQDRALEQKVAALGAELDQVIAEAERLKATHRSQADAAAEQIRDRADGAFEVENDGWFVQTADVTAVAADWVSTGTGAAAAACASTGVGAPLAVPLGVVSTVSGAVGTSAAVAQQLSGSRNAPGWKIIGLSLALDTVPVGPTVAAGVRSSRAVLKETAESSIAAARSEIRAAVRSGKLTGLVDEIRDLRTYGLREASSRELRDAGADLARRNGMLDDLPSDPAKRLETLEDLGVAQQKAQAYADLVGSTADIADRAGVELTPAQQRTLTMLQLGMNPTDAQLNSTAEGLVKDKVAGEG